MNAQFRILMWSIKKSLFWIILFSILVLISIILYIVRPIGIEITPSDFINLISFPTTIRANFISFMISLYQIVFTFYFTYLYYTYEFEYAFNNTIIRFNEKKWIVQKQALISTFLIIFRFLYTLLVFSYFAKFM